MSKKILVISSSPRKNGNSDLLCDQFVAGAQEAKNEVEKIFLKDVKINYCTGCGVCFEGAKRCSQKDDMAEILDKMVASDVIVMATPVYFYTMCAQMKTMIDRVCSRYTEIIDKEFYFIMTAAEADKKAVERTIVEFSGFTSCLSGAKEKGVIIGLGVWKAGEVKDKPVMKEAYLAGAAIR